MKFLLNHIENVTTHYNNVSEARTFFRKFYIFEHCTITLMTPSQSNELFLSFFLVPADCFNSIFVVVGENFEMLFLHARVFQPLTNFKTN